MKTIQSRESVPYKNRKYHNLLVLDMLDMIHIGEKFLSGNEIKKAIKF